MNNNTDNQVVYLRLDDIIPNRFQPREVFDETGLEELADSIKEHGVIQPVIVRKIGDKYELIAGERRSKASALAGLTTIPAIVRDMDDKESAKVSLLENLQRRNLSAIEEARTYKKILELDGMTQDELAKTMGKSQPMIANKLRLLALPVEVQDALIKNQISERHARSLLNIKNKEDQLNFLARIKKERLTVRELDSLIKDYNSKLNSKNEAPASFNESVTQQQPTSFGSSFGNNGYRNMGLSDYQSSVNNNMFNNIPNFTSNKTTENNPFNYQEKDYANANNALGDNTLYDNFNSTKDNSESLASMFDSKPLDSRPSTLESPNSNLFVSQIKEDVPKPQENQFLPNFDDDLPPNNFQSNFGFSNSLTSQNPRSFDVSGNFANMDNSNNMNNFNNMDSSNNYLNNNYLNNSYNSSENNNFNNNYFQSSNMQIPDMKIPDENNFSQNINERTNQGSLFNQPLNIVNVPSNNLSDDFNTPNTDFETTPQEFDSNNFANYEEDDMNSLNSLLSVPAVPIEPTNDLDNEVEPNTDTVSNSNDDLEVIDENPSNQDNHQEDAVLNNSKAIDTKNDYVTLEPVQTIFDVKGAILELKKTTDAIKQNKINIDTEEIEFDDYYQITIKIKK